jgi:DNA polymerase-3 subunit beta
MKAEFLTTNLKTAVKALKDGLKAAGLKTRDYDRIKVQLQAPTASALYFVLDLTPSVPVRLPANVLDGVAHAEALQFDNAGALLKALDAALKAAGKAGKLRLSGAPVAAGSTTTLGIADATTPDSDTGTELGEAVCIGGSNVLPTTLKEAEAYWEVEVSALDLWRALHIEVAAARDDHRPALTALYAGIEDGALTFAAADGYRLMVYSIPAERVAVNGGTKHTAQALIPAVAAGVWLGKLKALKDAPVRLRFEDGGERRYMANTKDYSGRVTGQREVVEKLDRVVLRVVEAREALGTAQALDHRFPPFRNVIPKNYHLRVEAETGSLMQAAKLAEIFARDNANTCRVKLDMDGSSEMGLGGHGLMTVYGKSQERGDVLTEVRAEFPDRVGAMQGDEARRVEFSCNVKYLMDMCKVGVAWDAPTVTLETKGSANPSVFRYSARPEALGVLMPMSR